MSKKKKGFTLAELLIVVAIIGVLVAISIPIFIRSRIRAVMRLRCQTSELPMPKHRLRNLLSQSIRQMVSSTRQTLLRKQLQLRYRVLFPMELKRV